MKAWRIISLVLWSLFLAGLLGVSTAYLLAYQTVLDQQALTQRMTQEAFVKSFREQVLIPRAQLITGTESAPSELIDEAMVKTALENAFSTEKTKEIITQSLPALHAWLDKKSPEIELSIPISDELKTFRNSINDQVGAKLKALPDCDTYAISNTDVTRSECIPTYLSAGTILEETMTSVDNALAQTPTEINAEMLGLTAKQLGPAYNTPDYLSYLWALNLVTTPLAALTIIYLILRRRGAGVFAVGITICILAAGLAIGSSFISNIFTSDNILAQSINASVSSLVSERMRFWGLIGTASGIVTIVLGSLWMRAQVKKKTNESHYVSERAEE